MRKWHCHNWNLGWNMEWGQAPTLQVILPAFTASPHPKQLFKDSLPPKRMRHPLAYNLIPYNIYNFQLEPNQALPCLESIKSSVPFFPWFAPKTASTISTLNKSAWSSDNIPPPFQGNLRHFQSNVKFSLHKFLQVITTSYHHFSY